MDFETAFTRVVGVEGGFTADPKDRGNWTTGRIGQGQCKGTKHGISAAAYPGEDIENLTLVRAQGLYARDYWGPAGCDAVPDALRYDLFDAAVNSGVKAAVKLLQLAAGEDDDGVLGPRTLQAVQSMPPLRTLARLNGYRLRLMASNPAWPGFGRGWALRVAANLIQA